MELRGNTHSNFNGPADPDTLRAEIASGVLNNHDGDDLDAEHTTKRVLRSFGIETERQLKSSMKQNRSGTGVETSMQFIRDQQERVLKQQQLIAKLQNLGRSTSQDEAVLCEYEASLRQLCNHGELMQVLLKPGRYDSDNTKQER
jgi:hypothetical protein